MAVLVFAISSQEPTGDVLVFLTGQDDIDAAVQLLTEEVQTNGKHSSGTPCEKFLFGPLTFDIVGYSQL